MDSLATEFNWRRPASFFQVAWSASRHPLAFFRALPQQGDLAPPLIFLLVLQALPFLAVLIKGQPLPVAAVNFLNNLARSLLFAAMFYVSGRFIMRSSLSLAGFLRVYAYAGGIWVLAVLLPFLPNAVALPLATVLLLYVLILLFLGLRLTAGLSVPLAAGVLVISIVALALLLSLLGPAQPVPPRGGG